jgi:hypothetical protein
MDIEMIENMKCCGNCSWRNIMDMGSCVMENCKLNRDETMPSAGYCYKWDFDNLTFKDRNKY